MKFRTEWKYICTDRDIDLLRSRIENLLETDENASGNVYHIHSLYFDDYLNSSAFDNDAGASERYKWRIRYYDDRRSFIKLEKKVKRNDLCFKLVTSLTEEQYDHIVNGDIDEVMYNSEDILLSQFCAEYLYRYLQPKVIIDYERTAYVEPVSNIRITFDRNISGSKDIERFLEGDFIRFPLQEKNTHVLEVKFDDVLPGHIEKMIHSAQLTRNTFSKYYLGRLIMERNLL